MQFMAVKLKSLGLLETDKLNDIISSLVCDKNFKTCMYRDCLSCSAKRIEGDEKRGHFVRKSNMEFVENGYSRIWRTRKY